MTWKDAFFDAVEHEKQPMNQATYWIIFLSCSLIFVFLVVSQAAQQSSALIAQNPEIVE